MASLPGSLHSQILMFIKPLPPGLYLLTTLHRHCLWVSLCWALGLLSTFLLTSSLFHLHSSLTVHFCRSNLTVSIPCLKLCQQLLLTVTKMLTIFSIPILVLHLAIHSCKSNSGYFQVETLRGVTDSVSCSEMFSEQRWAIPMNDRSVAILLL